jgi:hypothetical protein
VHHDIGIFHQPVDQRGVGDVTLHEGEAIGVESVERSQIAGVGELVEHGHMIVGVLQHIVHEVRTDETGPTGDEKLAHGISQESR